MPQVTSGRRYLTPPAVAELLGVDVHKVLIWIKCGQLRAVNVGDGPQRPRFRISPADLAAFEAARTVQPPMPRIRRRRRQPENIMEFFGPHGERRAAG